ncbi:MAG: primosomal protein N' [Syntrophales bacterium]|nr:primosomal protein N' [Syntrophales bacterium]
MRQEKLPDDHLMLVQIALNISSRQTFTYRIPEQWQSSISIGIRAIVPFGKTKKTGVIVNISDVDTEPSKVKDIIDLVDTEPLFGEDELRFYQWAADYYLYPLGKALSEILPGGEKKSTKFIKITPLGLAANLAPLSPAQREILEFLRSYPRGVKVGFLKKKSQIKNIDYALSRLIETGLIDGSEKMTGRQVSEKKEVIFSLNKEMALPQNLTPSQNRLINTLLQEGELTWYRLSALAGVSKKVMAQLCQKGLVVKKERSCDPAPFPLCDILERPSKEEITLNAYQREAREKIIEGIRRHTFSPFLLHGVTGSGKTEVYLEAIEFTLQLGGGVLFLVPEIALTPQLLGHLQNRFPEEEIAVLHSGISDQIRYQKWRNLKKGRIRIACGARSSVFAPVQNLRLVIVDEEHDESYKQEERFPYNARDLALVRGKMQRAAVILGSATPAIHTYHFARTGRYILISLPYRVEKKPLPHIEIVDMRLTGPGEEIISSPLKEAMREELKDGNQVMLFLNRRGFHSLLICRQCGYTFKCPNCDLSLTFHALPQRLICHYCDFSQAISFSCPRCGEKKLAGYGIGTEKVQSAVSQIFPSARICRLDRDTAEKPTTRSNLLKSIAERETDIIIGTQMISKGHDFPNITLVGVIGADISLHMPDFRASERTFQILTQVAGRGGRGDKPGRVIVQTFNPNHYVILDVQNHDYLSFFEKEIAYRSSLRYPPFCRLMCLHIAGADKDRSWQGAQALCEHIRSSNPPGVIELLGPAPAPISRMRGRYRWQIIVKGKDHQSVHQVGQLAQSYRLPTGIQLRCQIDPIDFM